MADVLAEGLSRGAIATSVSLKGLIGTKDTRFILVRPLMVKVKAYDLVLSGVAYVSITREQIA